MDGIEEDSVGAKAANILYPLLIGQVFGVAVTSITFIIVARLLGPTSYGIYTFAFGFSAVVNGFLAFGVGAYLSTNIARLMYKSDYEGVIRAVAAGYVIAGTASLCLTVLGIGISGYIAGMFARVGVSPDILMIAAGTIVFSIMTSIAVSALIGFSRSGLAALVNIIVDLIQLSLSVILTLKFGVVGAVSAMLIGYIAGGLVGGYLVYRAMSRHFRFRIYVPTSSDLMQIAGVTWPLAATNFLNNGVQNLSIVLLGIYISASALGNYGVAFKGLALIAMIYSTFGSGLLPIFGTAKAMEMGEKTNRVYNMIINFALMPMLPVIVYVGAMAVPGLHLLVGNNYGAAPYFLSLIAAGSTIGLFSAYMHQLFISGSKTKSVLKINAISGVVQVALLVALLPKFAVIGAIAAIFFFGNIIEVVLFAIDAKKHFGLRLETQKLLKLYLCNAFLWIIVFAVYSASGFLLQSVQSPAKDLMELAAGLVVAVLIYPVMLIAFRAVDRIDIERMKKATAKLGRISYIFGGFFAYSERIYSAIIR